MSRGVFPLRVRDANAGVVAGVQAKQFALMQVKKSSRAARIGALRKHFRRSLGGGNVPGELNSTTGLQNSNLLFQRNGVEIVCRKIGISANRHLRFTLWDNCFR